MGAGLGNSPRAADMQVDLNLLESLLILGLGFRVLQEATWGCIGFRASSPGSPCDRDVSTLGSTLGSFYLCQLPPMALALERRFQVLGL